jgi:ribosome-binding protein aMBF1 (putative translation factor)
MGQKVASAMHPSHRVLPEKADRMVSSVLRKTDTDDSLKEFGECLDFARRMEGWTLDQLARELTRVPRQVRRWIAGEERTQVEWVRKFPALWQWFLIALARGVDTCEECTTLVFRRRA